MPLDSKREDASFVRYGVKDSWVIVEFVYK